MSEVPATKVPYTKLALTLDQQVAQLRARGMLIADEVNAKHYLGYINYYRLTAYWLPFEIDHSTHQFQPDTTFDQVLDRYIFDRELRLLLIDAIERVEVAIRTQFAYQLGHKYGSHPLLNSDLFEIIGPRWNYNDNLRHMVQEANNSKEVFMRHLMQKYSESIPPIWAAVEIMTLGQLSKWYANLKRRPDRNWIAHMFDFDEVNFVSFIHHLAIVRNLCAHHSRVWNRDFAFTFKIPRQRPSAVLSSLNTAKPKKLYNTLVMLIYLLNMISPGHHVKQRLVTLLNTHAIPDTDMGFPADWQHMPLWQ